MSFGLAMLEFGSCTAAVAAVCAVKPGDSLKLAVPALLFVLQNAVDVLDLLACFGCEASQVTAVTAVTAVQQSQQSQQLSFLSLNQTSSNCTKFQHLTLAFCVTI